MISNDDIIHTTMNTFSWTMLEPSLGIISTCSLSTPLLWSKLVAIGNARPNEIDLDAGRLKKLQSLHEYDFHPQDVADGITISLLIPSN